MLLASGSAAFAAAPKADGQVPTNITAERMQYDAANQRVIFEGNVHVKRPDFELWSAKLTVFLEKTKGPRTSEHSANATASSMGAMGMDAGNLERIVAEKNVRMKQETKMGTCGKATYTASDGKVVMEDEPVIVDGSNRIAGKVIHFYTRDNRSEVIGGVQAAFTTSDKQDGQKSLIPGQSSSGNATEKQEKSSKPARKAKR